MAANIRYRKYSGVSRLKDCNRACPYYARMRLNFPPYRVLELGCYPVALDAAWVADFAKYMLHGLDPATWRHRGIKPISKPNFPPCVHKGVNRRRILRLLFINQAIDAVTMARREAEYDRLAALPLVK